VSKLTTASISRVLWALVLVTLPVTSFRYIPFMGAGTYVRPLALYPLLLLLPILLIRIKRAEIVRPWPGIMTILLAFLLVGMAATAYGAALAPLELRGVGFFDRALRAGVTLAIGLGFFVAAVWMNQTEEDLKFSVRWLMVGLAAHLLWGAVQFIGLNSGQRKLLLEIQNLFSVRGLVKNKRISGFAYEPSWLAGQIVTLYFPWLLAALLTRIRAFAPAGSSATRSSPLPAPAWFSLSSMRSMIEPVLLLAALVGLLMTYSRSGLLLAFLAGELTFILAGAPALKHFWIWVREGFNRQRWIDTPTIIRAAGSRIFLALVFLGALAGAVFFLADKGYIAAFFKSEKTDLLSYAQDVYLGPRLAYAHAALAAFEDHPFTGVGLGASGFGMYQNMPDWILSGEPEIARQMSPASNLYPNPKNIYVRLLAETGLPGFVLFLSFYLALFGNTLSLLRGSQSARSAPAHWLAAAGIFSLTAVMLHGVSQDSFAMPEMWLNLGMLAGASGAFAVSTSRPPHPER